MAKPIFSEKKFLRTFKPGDTFWHMESIHGTPTGIAGPVLILSFASHEIGTRVNVVESGGYHCDFVGDLTNRCHGAFTNEKDALVYFAKRKYKYATNPRLIAEVAAKVADAEEYYRCRDPLPCSAMEDHFQY